MSIFVIIPVLYRYFEHLHLRHHHNFSKRLHFEHLYHHFSKHLHFEHLFHRLSKRLLFEHLFHHFSKWLHRVHLATPRRISQNTCVSLTPRLGPRKAFSEKIEIEIEISTLSHPPWAQESLLRKKMELKFPKLEDVLILAVTPSPLRQYPLP